jgi:hypothetical protein
MWAGALGSPDRTEETDNDVDYVGSAYSLITQILLGHMEDPNTSAGVNDKKQSS